MGRDKNRTKGNVKPANSGRSAELLQSFGKEGLIPTTLLGGSSIPPVLGSGASSLLTDESQLDTNMTILLRKLGKKDSTTKLKALAELTEICTADPDVCNQILKYWPNYYAKLARDDDRKVREMSHVALQLIGNNVGRNLATQIKNLFPVWFLSTSDTFPVVATKAQSAFVNIFPTIDKQVQVCRFCVKEIFAFIRTENMFEGNELSKVTAIDAAIKLIQMGICDNENEEGAPGPSPTGEDEQQQEQCGFDIDLDSDSFWNLGKDESSLVRRSFYTLLTILAEKKLEQLNPKKHKLNQIMKTSLTEEKLELETLWNCYLTLIMKGFYPDKLFAKNQIITCLNHGFYGNANILGPLLLPLVAKVGPFPGDEIYVALEKGYDLEKGTNEGAAIMRTYAEILAFEFQSTTQVPARTFPFLFRNLAASSEFGRVIGNMIKSSSDKFFEELKSYIFQFAQSEEGLQSLQAHQAIGNFVLSFIEPLRKRAMFRESGHGQGHQSNASLSRKEPIAYEPLDEVKKSFVKAVTVKLIELKAWKPFSVISRSLASEAFFKDVAAEPENWKFEADTKIEGLRITLDLARFYPNAIVNSNISGFGEFVNKFFGGEDVSLFLQEIESSTSSEYESLPAVSQYLQSDAFLSNENSSVTKYILKKGVGQFSQEMVDQRIALLCDCTFENINIPLIQKILTTSTSQGSSKVNMRRLYLKIWQMFLDIQSQQTEKVEDDEEGEAVENQNQKIQQTQNQSEQIESISYYIVRNSGLEKSELFEKICEEVPKCQNIVGLDNLVEIALKTVDEFVVKDIKDYSSSSSNSGESFDFDPDMLVFHGFSQNPMLTFADDSSPNPPFVSQKLVALLKTTYFESRLTMQMNVSNNENETTTWKTDQLIQLGLNLLFAVAAYEVWQELDKYNWEWEKSKHCDELKTELIRVLELLETPQNLTEFWNRVQAKGVTCTGNSSALWSSKYPERYLLEICTKMELTIPKLIEEIPTNPSSGVGSILTYLQHPSADTAALVKMLETERRNFPDKFKFETLFSHIAASEQSQLLNYLVLAIELAKREPSFVSTAACWVSSWLRYGKAISNSKIRYLWVQKLSQAVIVIDSISKTVRDSDFVQEYVEFHAMNLFPGVYSHFIQLNSGMSNPWKEICAISVCTAIALTPTPILLNIESDSAIIFEVCTPILLKKPVPFQLAAYHLMRRMKVKDEVIIPKELAQLLARKVQDETKYDKVLMLLLGWDALLKAQLNTFELANFVKKDELLPRLLNLLFFKLIPEGVNLKAFFDTKPILTPNALPQIQHLSCYLLQEILRCLPYTVRWWWSLNLKQREKIIVEKLITKYLSAKLAAEELGKVQLNESQDNAAGGADLAAASASTSGSDNVTVDSHPGCNELIAKYKIEETNVILKITLPLNHPLGPVDVHISDRKLHSRISQLLNTRSHSLSSGLKLWKDNLDNTYANVDECAICFFILHNVTKALPKLACSQCRKKFHAACLYKWFSTSNKSECPLCRNLF